MNDEEIIIQCKKEHKVCWCHDEYEAINCFACQKNMFYLLIKKSKQEGIKKAKFMLFREIDFDCHRYIINTNRNNGITSGEHHWNIVKSFYYFISEDENKHEQKDGELYLGIHKISQEVTSYLDKKIGLPLDGKLAGNDFNIYVKRLKEELFKLIPKMRRLEEIEADEEKTKRR